MNDTTVLLEPPHPAVWAAPSPPEAFNGTKVLFSFANCSTRPPADCNGHGTLGGVCFCNCDEGYDTDFSNVLNIRWCVPTNTLPTAGYRTVNITDPAYAGSSGSTTNAFLLWLGTRTGMAVSYTISCTILAASVCFLCLCIRRYRQAKAARARGKARETHYYHHYPEGGEGRGRGCTRPSDDRGNFFKRWWLRKARGPFAADNGGGGSPGGRRGTVALPAGAAASSAMAVQLLALQQALRHHQQQGDGSGASLDPAMLQATLAALTGAMAGGGGGAGAGGGAPWSQASAGSPQHPPPPQQHRSYDSPARGRTSSVDRHPQRRPSGAGGPARYGSPGHGPGDRSRSFVNPLAYMGQEQPHDGYDPYQQQSIVPHNGRMPYSPAGGRQSRHGSAGAAPRAHGSMPGGRPMGHSDPTRGEDRRGAPVASPMRGGGGGVRRPTSLGGGLAEPEAAAVVTLPARQDGQHHHGKYGMDYGEAKDYSGGHYDEGRGYY